ncbi:hypothetical protein BSL78_19743 [Apostichopus japonicus]|uniref:Reverse transcriptase domain-containing protein n=1 Tax=Stichopus japonicus TaxID=307972 RepID=A0A2G8K614_STIJA|nr:hypothetical protein BSL78_19743 [Apostichopus japonicus]
MPLANQYVMTRCKGNTNVIITVSKAKIVTDNFLSIFHHALNKISVSGGDVPLIKFADDTAMAGLIHGDDDEAYLRQLQSFVDYCDTNFLQLNISKTKEMVIDFRRSTVPPPPVIIKGVEVERVSSYKYLGVHLNDSLTWGDQVDALIKTLNSRLYCLNKMARFNVRTSIMDIFYNATICGVWRYCFVGWGGNATGTDKDRIDSIIRKGGRVIGDPNHQLRKFICACSKTN